jgi:hypothetical protein
VEFEFEATDEVANARCLQRQREKQARRQLTEECLDWLSLSRKLIDATAYQRNVLHHMNYVLSTKTMQMEL